MFLHVHFIPTGRFLLLRLAPHHHPKIASLAYRYIYPRGRANRVLLWIWYASESSMLTLDQRRNATLGWNVLAFGR